MHTWLLEAFDGYAYISWLNTKADLQPVNQTGSDVAAGVSGGDSADFMWYDSSLKLI